ncbi:MAG: hypothetical protein R3338_13620, partial [Thermoanaerobaculia bacterium]|nr:hypothetical protein [Thermoanaerobaculia bacterium]
MNPSAIWPVVESWARREGILCVGASDLDDRAVEVFHRWLSRGHEAGMHYLRKNLAVRRDPR